MSGKAFKPLLISTGSSVRLIRVFLASLRILTCMLSLTVMGYTIALGVIVYLKSRNGLTQIWTACVRDLDEYSGSGSAGVGPDQDVAMAESQPKPEVQA